MKDLAIEQPFDMAGNGNAVAADWMLPMKVDYGGGARILVVEDDPVNIRVILHTLMHEKYNITVMGKGEEVLAALDGGLRGITISFSSMSCCPRFRDMIYAAACGNTRICSIYPLSC